MVYWATNRNEKPRFFNIEDTGRLKLFWYWLNGMHFKTTNRNLAECGVWFLRIIIPWGSWGLASFDDSLGESDRCNAKEATNA